MGLLLFICGTWRQQNIVAHSPPPAAFALYDRIAAGKKTIYGRGILLKPQASRHNNIQDKEWDPPPSRAIFTKV